MTDTDRAASEDALSTVTVNLTPGAMAAVEAAAARTGDSKTDTINRAVRMYAAIMAADSGSRISFERTPGVPCWVLVVSER